MNGTTTATDCDWNPDAVMDRVHLAQRLGDLYVTGCNRLHRGQTQFGRLAHVLPGARHTGIEHLRVTVSVVKDPDRRMSRLAQCLRRLLALIVASGERH